MKFIRSTCTFLTFWPPVRLLTFYHHSKEGSSWTAPVAIATKCHFVQFIPDSDFVALWNIQALEKKNICQRVATHTCLPFMTGKPKNFTLHLTRGKEVRMTRAQRPDILCVCFGLWGGPIKVRVVPRIMDLLC